MCVELIPTSLLGEVLIRTQAEYSVSFKTCLGLGRFCWPWCLTRNIYGRSNTGCVWSTDACPFLSVLSCEGRSSPMTWSYLHWTSVIQVPLTRILLYCPQIRGWTLLRMQQMTLLKLSWWGRIEATHPESIRIVPSLLHATPNAWCFQPLCSSRAVCRSYQL